MYHTMMLSDSLIKFIQSRKGGAPALSRDRFILKKTILMVSLVLIQTMFIFAQTETGDTLHIKADMFKFFDDRIEFYNHAEIIKGTFSLISEKFFTILREQGEDRTIEATQGIFVVFETGKATATELTYDLREEIGTMRKEVHSIINAVDSVEIVEVFCDILNFETPTKQYSGKNETTENPVKIYRGELYAESQEFLYDGNAGVIELFGKVYVYDPKNKRKLWGEYVKLFLKNDTLEARSAVMEIITQK